jgi:hypothetical protein
MGDADDLDAYTAKHHRAASVPSWELIEAADRVAARARAAVRRVDPTACNAVQVEASRFSCVYVLPFVAKKHALTIC